MTRDLQSHNSEPLLRPAMPELDSIRGLAILMVLLYHGLYWSNDLSVYPRGERLLLTLFWIGRLGVNLFFVLSGFLITGLLVDAREKAYYYGRFYLRRALRILPAYLLVLVALAILRYPAKFLFLSLAYLSNLTPLWGIAIAYPVLWSLAVEEHFYFAWPAVVKKLRNRALLGLSIGIILLSPVLRLATYYLCRREGAISFVVYDYTWNSADGLACGAALAVFVREYCTTKRRRLAVLVVWLVFSAALLWAVGLPFGIVSRQNAIGGALQVVPWHFCFTALLGIFLLAGTSPWKAWVTLRPLRFLGEISYGLYLCHLLVFDAANWLLRHWQYDPTRLSSNLLLLRLLAAGGTAILVAALSRRYFEEPFLRLKERFLWSASERK